MSDDRKRNQSMPHRGDAPVPTAEAEEAANHLGQEDADPDKQEGGDRTPTTGTIKNPGGLSSGLQPGGTIPGKSPGASVGSIGTGGGSTAGAPTGTAKRTV